MRDDELAYATLDYIREHPQEWDQDEYLCGTTACFAGHVVRIKANAMTEAQARNWMNARCGESFYRGTGEIARELLGWSPDEAHHVFNNFTNDFTALERSVKEVLNGEVGQ